MEFAYRKIIGPLNPKTPNQSLKMLIFVLKFIGMWPPETESRLVRTIYAIYSIIFRIFVWHCYIICEALYFRDVSDIFEAADALFILLTNISLAYKLEKFYSNRYRIQACVRKLNSDLFTPQNEEEDEIVKNAMLFLLGIWIFYSTPSGLTIISLGLVPFISQKMILPISGVYPLDTTKFVTYVPVYLYQVIGLGIGAASNIASDTCGVALLLHIRAQIDRLGLQLSKIGYDSKKIRNLRSDRDDELKENQENKRKIYTEFKRCVNFHRELLKFAAEVEDIYKGPIFCQFMLSSVVICMTLFIISELSDISKLLMVTPYLMAMIVQIFLFCFSGNEVIWASNRLTKKIYFSNFDVFDLPTRRSMIFLMQRTQKSIVIKAGGIFKVSLSLEVFLGVMKTSYSYFALLKSME